MRVLLVNSFHYRRGGDAGQFLDLADSLESRGHAVAVFSMEHPQNLPSRWSGYWAPNVEYREEFGALGALQAGWRSIYSLDVRRRMGRLITDFRPDVVHAHGVHHHLTTAVVDACTAAEVPIAWTLHDYRTVCPATHLICRGQVCRRCSGGAFWHGALHRCKSGSAMRSLAAVLEAYLTRLRGSLAAVDCYIAPSHFLARTVTWMGLPARRLEVLPNPVQSAPGPSAPAEKGSPALYVGRLSAEKGVEHLVRAVAARPGLSLRVVGDGPERERLARLAADLDADAVFDGWVDAAGVTERMAAASLLCVPSTALENCPGVVLEAMTLGLPVVATDRGGLPELLDAGRAGWLAPAGDPLALREVLDRALDEREATHDKAAHALARVRYRHDPERFVGRLESIYESLSVN